MAAEAIVRYEPGHRLSARANGVALIAGRFVMISGNAGQDGNVLVIPATNGAEALGVACFDAIAEALTSVSRGGSVIPVDAGAALTGGGPVMSDGTGQAIPWVAPGIVLGTAWADAAINTRALIVQR